MSAVRLRSDTPLGLLVADLVVLGICLPGVFASEVGVPRRAFFGAVSLMAVGFGLRSALLILRGARTRRAARGTADREA